MEFHEILLMLLLLALCFTAGRYSSTSGPECAITTNRSVAAPSSSSRFPPEREYICKDYQRLGEIQELSHLPLVGLGDLFKLEMGTLAVVAFFAMGFLVIHTNVTGGWALSYFIWTALFWVFNGASSAVKQRNVDSMEYMSLHAVAVKLSKMTNRAATDEAKHWKLQCDDLLHEIGLLKGKVLCNGKQCSYHIQLNGNLERQCDELNSELDWVRRENTNLTDSLKRTSQSRTRSPVARPIDHFACKLRDKRVRLELEAKISKVSELTQRVNELQSSKTDNDKRTQEMDARSSELDSKLAHHMVDIEKRAQELDTRSRDMDSEVANLTANWSRRQLNLERREQQLLETQKEVQKQSNYLASIEGQATARYEAEVNEKLSLRSQLQELTKAYGILEESKRVAPGPVARVAAAPSDSTVDMTGSNQNPFVPPASQSGSGVKSFDRTPASTTPNKTGGTFPPVAFAQPAESPKQHPAKLPRPGFAHPSPFNFGAAVPQAQHPAELPRSGFAHPSPIAFGAAAPQASAMAGSAHVSTFPSVPLASAAVPPASTALPTVSAASPPVSAVNPPLSAVNPTVSAANPTVSASNPTVSVANPTVSAANPIVSAASPAVSATNPTVTATATATVPQPRPRARQSLATKYSCLRKLTQTHGRPLV
jgi:hypothetical protein